MTTIIVILIVFWVVVQVVRLVGKLWSAVSGESSPRTELAEAA
jgi:hypothetical protein